MSADMSREIAKAQAALVAGVVSGEPIPWPYFRKRDENLTIIPGLSITRAALEASIANGPDDVLALMREVAWAATAFGEGFDGEGEQEYDDDE